MQMPTSGSPSASATAEPSRRSPDLTTMPGSPSSRRCSEARRRQRVAPVPRSRLRSRPLANSSSVPRRGARVRAPPAEVGAPALDRAIEDYLTYLRVERGLSPATIRAYRADLSGFAAGEGVAEAWGDGPEPARRHLAARTRRGTKPPDDGGLAPTSLRRRAASIRGFYRFAYGDGLIDKDVAA